MPTPPSQAAGYSLIFSDEFDTLDLSPDGTGTHKWYPGLWYESASGAVNGSSISASVLDLKWTRGQSPSVDTSIQTYNKANTAGQTFRYGYFEARMKWDVAQGAWPAFWLNGDFGQSNQGFMELDIFEGQGTSGKYYATLHDWIKDSSGTHDRLSDGNNEINVGSVDFSQWHTYGCLWTPGQVKWYFDDQLIRTASTPASADTGPALCLILSCQVGPGWNTGGSPVSNTMNNYVDWVRVWQTSGSGTVASGPSITTSSLPSGSVGAGYQGGTYSITASGGTTPYSWALAAGTMPPGLSFNTVIGRIEGTPAVAGTYAFTVRVTDAGGKTATASYSLTIAPQAGLNTIITTTAIPNATLGVPYSASESVTGPGSGFVWSIQSGALPPGLTLNSSTGTISGTPTTAGNYFFVTKATDSVGRSGSASWPLTVFATIPSTITPPAQIASGYALDWHDEFDTLDLSPDGTGTHNWYPGLWYATPPPSTQFSVSNSVAQLKWSASTGQPETQMSTLMSDGATGKTWRYGYFEARMKWDVLTGAWPVFWLDSGLSGAASSTSMDVFQGQAAAPHTYNASIAAYTGATQTFLSSPNSADLPATNDFSQFHKYGVLWTPGQVKWYFDDQLILSAPVPSASDSQTYYLILGMLEGIGWSEGVTTGVTATDLSLYVDWIRVWKPTATSTGTGTGGTPTGTGSGSLPTGPGTGTTGNTQTGNTPSSGVSGPNVAVSYPVTYKLPFNYPGYLTSQYQTSPKLISWLNTALSKVEDVVSCFAQFPSAFDLDTSAGNALDLLGQLIGQSRVVGFQPSAGISPRLDDSTYRTLLKSRLWQNQWDGRIDSLQGIWQKLFPGGSINIQDAQNMTATIILSGGFTSIMRDLISNGYIVPRPQGVLYNYSFSQLPAFGTDQDNDFIAGFDKGKLT